MAWWIPVAMAAAALYDNYNRSQGQAAANEQNMDIAQAQMNFQRDMSNTAHQRAAQDMARSGINPMLAGHNAASTPAGATATMENAAMEPGQAVGAAVAGMQMKMGMEKTGAEIGNIESSTKTNEANAEAARSKAFLDRTSAMKTAVDTQNAKLEQEMIKNQLPKSRIDRDMAKPDAILNRVERGAGIVDKLYGPFGTGKKVHDNYKPTWKK